MAFTSKSERLTDYAHGGGGGGSGLREKQSGSMLSHKEY